MTTYTGSTALIVVDCQNDFAEPAGSLFVEGADAVIAATNREIITACAAGAIVVYTQDWHPADTPHFEKDGGIWPVHCVADTWGAEFHPRLIVAGPSVRKGTTGEDGYSGFTTRDPRSGDEAPTGLHDLLSDSNITDVIVVGLALDYCVKETASDAHRLGYRTSVLRSATAAVDVERGDGEAAITGLLDVGVTLV